jgi:hypothetical protein
VQFAKTYIFLLLLELTDVTNLLVDRKWLPTNHTLSAKERGWQGGDVDVGQTFNPK